jgi:hypothetical protein
MITDEDKAGIEQRFLSLSPEEQDSIRTLVNDPAAPLLAFLLNISKEEFRMLASELLPRRRGFAARQR